MNVTIDLITHDPKRDAYILVAVEQGPWPTESIGDELLRLQNKLLDYVDLAVDGALAQRYPNSIGKLVVIRLDSYDIPCEQAEQMFFRLAEYVHESPEIQSSVAEKRFVARLDFEINHRSLENDA